MLPGLLSRFPGRYARKASVNVCAMPAAAPVLESGALDGFDKPSLSRPFEGPLPLVADEAFVPRTQPPSRIDFANPFVFVCPYASPLGRRCRDRRGES